MACIAIAHMPAQLTKFGEMHERFYTYSLIHPDMFASRPALRILQMAWHPCMPLLFHA